MTGLLPAPPAPVTGARRTLARGAAFWLVAAMTSSVLAASSAPSPLYPVLQAQYGFSAITLTVIFAAYVLALLAALLTVGRLSDYVGRRPVLAVALVVEAGAMVMFLVADGVGPLIAARVVQGVATGGLTGVLGAYLLDLQPGGTSRLGSLVNSVAPTAGLGIGSICTGLLVEFAPHPTRLVFAILIVLFVALAVAVVALPETVRPMPGAIAAMRPQVAVPPAARRAFAGAVPTMLVTWALGGLTLSIGGSLVDVVFHQHSHAVAGVMIGIFALSGAGGALVASSRTPAVATRVGTTVLAVGAVIFIVAVASSSLPVFVVASVVAGSGFGAAFLGALRAVTQLAEPHERAALLSAVYVVSYLAFSVPAVVAGVLIVHVGLRPTALGYGGVVLVVALSTLAYEALAGRRAS